MANKIYAVTGATGNVGSVVSEILLEHGHNVRAIGRSKERLQSLIDKGAEPFVGSVDDTKFVQTALENATGVFAMIPPNYFAKNYPAFQDSVAKSLADAVKNSRVSHVVTLSSIGAELEDGTGPIKGLHKLEQRFNDLENVNVVHLRPASFMENLLFGVDTIKNLGVNGSALEADKPIAMIATKDIAAVAAELLESLDFSGKLVRELQGPKDISMTEATRVLGKAIGRDDLKYVQFSYDDVRQALASMGMSASAVDELIELYKAVNEDLVRPQEQRSPANTTPTTFEEFSKTFAGIYKASGEASSEASAGK